jgi:hypothetical protein
MIVRPDPSTSRDLGATTSVTPFKSFTASPGQPANVTAPTTTPKPYPVTAGSVAAWPGYPQHNAHADAARGTTAATSYRQMAAASYASPHGMTAPKPFPGYQFGRPPPYPYAYHTPYGYRNPGVLPAAHPGPSGPVRNEGQHSNPYSNVINGRPGQPPHLYYP